MRKLILLVLTGLLLIPAGYAFSLHSSPPKFTSVYTDLEKQCKNAFKEVGEGQDMPLVCKGYGGYKISIGYSAMYSHLAAETLNGKNVIPLATAEGSNYGKKVEWRLANGKPFAVIVRANDKLYVKGLRGYEKIDYDVDAKTPNANQQARDLADKAYAP